MIKHRIVNVSEYLFQSDFRSKGILFDRCQSRGRESWNRISQYRLQNIFPLHDMLYIYVVDTMPVICVRNPIKVWIQNWPYCTYVYRETFLNAISMVEAKVQQSNTVRLLGLTFSIIMKWGDSIESIATFTARKVRQTCTLVPARNGVSKERIFL